MMIRYKLGSPQAERVHLFNTRFSFDLWLVRVFLPDVELPAFGGYRW
jgi:hypothetical protein